MSNDLFGKRILRRKKKIVYSGSPQDPNDSSQEKNKIDKSEKIDHSHYGIPKCDRNSVSKMKT